MSIQFAWYKSGQHLRAFSLVECIVVITLILTLSLLSLPIVPSWWQRHRLGLVVSHLHRSISFARTWAVLHQTDLVLCGSADGKRCDGDWSSGWLILPRHSQLPIRVMQHASSVRIRWVGNHRKRAGIYFQASGGTAGQQGRFICSVGKFKQTLVLIRSGRVRMSVG